MVKPELRTAIASPSIFSVLKRYTKLVEIRRSIITSPMPPRFRVLAILTKRSLFIDNLDCWKKLLGNVTEQNYNSINAQRFIHLAANNSKQIFGEYLKRKSLTLGLTRKVIPPPWYKVGGWMEPSPEFLICCSISKRFYLKWKAFNLLNKMRYIL